MENRDEPLTKDERAELEQLRAEKAARERASIQERKAVERERRLMEPGDDLSMPTGQKIVLIVVALLAAAGIAMIVLGH